jgi:hypothetical protein
LFHETPTMNSSSAGLAAAEAEAEALGAATLGAALGAAVVHAANTIATIEMNAAVRRIDIVASSSGSPHNR